MYAICCLQNSLESVAKRNLETEQEILNLQNCHNDTRDKLEKVESQYLQLQQDLHKYCFVFLRKILCWQSILIERSQISKFFSPHIWFKNSVFRY